MFVLDKKIRDTLIRYHAISMIVHIIAAIIIIIIVLIMEVPYKIVLDKQYFTIYEDIIPAYLKTTFCPIDENGTAVLGAKEYTNAFNFINCVRNQGNDIDVPRILRSVNLNKIEMWPIIVFMQIFSAFIHYSIAFYTRVTSLYLYFLKLDISPFRYIEFSITHVLLIVSLFALNEITDIYIMLYVSFTTASINVVSWMGFEIISSLQKLPSLDSERYTLMDYYKYTLLLFGYMYFVLSIVIMMETYEISIQTYFNLPNKQLWHQIYSLVLVVNIGITVLYCIFPLLHGIQNGYITNRYLKEISYIAIEPIYIINSTLAQSFLSIAIIIATIQRY